MIAIRIQKVENTIKLFKYEIERQRVVAYRDLADLSNTLSSKLNTAQKEYMDKITPLFLTTEIITGKPSYLKQKLEEIKEIPVVNDGESGVTDLSNQIIKALGYKVLRESFYPEYFKHIGIKACVYCNSQYTVSVDVKEYLQTKVNDHVFAKFQVDHHHNKATYPFLSISLYNLYPACASCNVAKSKTAVDFDLYTDTVCPSRYSFSFDLNSRAKYLLDKNPEDIKFSFIDPDQSKPEEKGKGCFQDTFDIEGIYNTQKDIVEELIIKAEIYNEAYKETLKNNFPELFGSENLSNRVFFGNYTDPEDIHKRPLAKFMQDIARELKLIE